MGAIILVLKYYLSIMNKKNKINYEKIIEYRYPYNVNKKHTIMRAMKWEMIFWYRQ